MRRSTRLRPIRLAAFPVGRGGARAGIGGGAVGRRGVAERASTAVDAAFLRDPACMEGYAGDTKLPLPRAMLRPALPLTAKLMARLNKADDAKAKADLAALPAQLDHIDAWIADGVLGGEQPNAADLQIGSSIRLLLTIADVRPLLDERPCCD